MRLKAKGHDASPRTALGLLARIHFHESRIADRTINGLAILTAKQLDRFEILNLP